MSNAASKVEIKRARVLFDLAGHEVWQEGG